MAIFNKKDLNDKNTFNKMFKTEPKNNFPIELENLLADYENSLDSLTCSNINSLAEKYKINLEKDFVDERKALIQKLVEASIAYNRISDSSYKTIKHLNEIIALPLSVFQIQINETVTPIYQNKVNEFLCDNYMTDYEKNQLESLRQDLKLSRSVADDIYRKCVKSKIDSYINPILNSEMFSPEDEERMFEAAKRLGLKLKFPPEIQEKLSRYRQNWEIAYGNLPVLQSDIRLPSNEKLHFKLNVTWMEERTVTKRVNYSGFTYSTKVIGNIRWKAGTITPHRITEEQLKPIDSGTLYLTNKRFIFDGQHGNKVLPLSKVIAFTPYLDGMLVEKDTGRSPFFQFDGEATVRQLASILSRLLSE